MLASSVISTTEIPNYISFAVYSFSVKVSHWMKSPIQAAVIVVVVVVVVLLLHIKQQLAVVDLSLGRPCYLIHLLWQHAAAAALLAQAARFCCCCPSSSYFAKLLMCVYSIYACTLTHNTTTSTIDMFFLLTTGQPS